MSLKPIDLQTLFVRLDQVAKQQSNQQEAPLHAQQVAGQEIEQKSLRSDQTVQKADELGDGPEKVHDEEEREHPKGKGRHPNGESEEDGSQEAAEQKRKANPFRDPDLGNHIDISG